VVVVELVDVVEVIGAFFFSGPTDTHRKPVEVVLH
jgi:hypothetical protein